VEVETDATPEAFTVADPNCDEPFMKLIVPVGVVVPEPFTVAVSVNVWPVVIEVPEASREVVVDWADAVTVTETVPDVLPREAVFPAYWAVIEYVPVASEDVEIDATPEAFTVAEPRDAPPFMKLTVPVGVVVPEPFTVAVSVSVWPVVIDVPEAARLVVVDCSAFVTVTDTEPEVLAFDPALPAYWAVRL
jgi:hypothetical protein